MKKTGRGGQINKAAAAGRDIRSVSDLAAGTSPLHRMPPLIKLIMTVIYIVLTVSFHKYDISGLFVMILFPVLGYAVSGTPLKTCFYKLRFILPLVCAVGLLNPFFDRLPVMRILLPSGPTLAVSGGVLSMLTLMLKGVFCLMASFLLTATTPVEGIARALRQIRVPKTLTTLFLLTFRYVGVLLDEVAVMTDAYHLRAPRQKGIEVKAWGSFLGQLILRSQDRASALYESMLLRGFSGEFYDSGRNSDQTAEAGSGISSGQTAAAGAVLTALIVIGLMILVRFVNVPAWLVTSLG